MLDAVAEEHKVHGRVVGIVDFELLIKLGNQLVSFTQLDILRTVLEVTEEDIFIVLNLPIHVKVAFHDLVSDGHEFAAILLINETISEDSEGLVKPQVHEIVLVGEVLKINHEHALDDLGEISQVESVVALGGGREEVTNCLDIDVHRGLDDRLCKEAEAR
jgi:hypothetical protein